MFEIVLKRLAESSDLIFVMGVFLALFIYAIIHLYRKTNSQEKAYSKAIVKLTIAHDNKTQKLNDDILNALIASTSAMVSLNGNYEEIRSDYKELKSALKDLKQ